MAPSDPSGTVLEDCLRVRRLLDVATGGVWDSFVLLPRTFGCWGSFARAFLPGRLDSIFLVDVQDGGSIN